MAIKVNNVTVIDNGPVISAGGTTGVDGQLLKSTGVGITWTFPSGGSGTFDTGISTSAYVSVSAGIGTNTLTFQNIFSAPGVAYSFPSTAGLEYIIESIHITNKSGDDLFISGRHDFSGGERVPIANRIPVPYQSSVDLLEEPKVANPSDVIRLQALTGIGTDATGHDGGLDAFITISQKADTTYIGVGETIVSTDQELFTATTGAAVVQSISLANYNNNVDADVTVSLFRGGTVGGIATTGIRQGYLAFNLTVPRNSIVEICAKPKHLKQGDSILVSSTPTNSVGVILAGKYIV